MTGLRFSLGRPGIHLLIGWCFLLALGRMHTGLSGAAWLGWCLTGAWWAWRGLPEPEVPALDPRPGIWLHGLLLFSICMIVPGLFWQEPFKEREETWRMVFAAAATLALYRRLRPSEFQSLREWFMGAAILACLLGWATVAWSGRDRLPANAIPWAMGMAFWLACLWPWCWQTKGGRRWIGLGAMWFGVWAVILSDTRGAYWILPWLALTGMWWWWRERPRGWRSHARALGLALIVAMAAHWSGGAHRVWERVHLGWNEWQRAGVAMQAAEQDTPGSEQGLLTSMGVRRLLWTDAWEGIQAHPWTGIGQQARQARIADLAIRMKIPQLSGFVGHLHNEYLNDLLDHGVWGLLALLILLVTLLRLCLLSQGVARWQLAGITSLHALGGLTNVNFAHNDYSLMLGMLVSMVLVGSGPHGRRSNHSPG